MSHRQLWCFMKVRSTEALENVTSSISFWCSCWKKYSSLDQVIPWTIWCLKHQLKCCERICETCSAQEPSLLHLYNNFDVSHGHRFWGSTRTRQISKHFLNLFKCLIPFLCFDRHNSPKDLWNIFNDSAEGFCWQHEI